MFRCCLANIEIVCNVNFVLSLDFAALDCDKFKQKKKEICNAEETTNFEDNEFLVAMLRHPLIYFEDFVSSMVMRLAEISNYQMRSENC